LCLAFLGCGADSSDTAPPIQGSESQGDLSAITVRGKATQAGVDFDWTLILRSDGKALSEIGHLNPEVTGFDGERVWRTEGDAGPFSVDFAEREVWLLALGLLRDASGFEGSLLPIDVSEDEAVRISPGSLVFSSQRLDKLVAINSPNKESVTFLPSESGNPGSLPERIQIENIGHTTAYRIDSSSIGPAPDDPYFSSPTKRIRHYRFHPEAEAMLTTRQAESGHLFVRPLVAGQDLGWFLFDSGAGFSGINAATARELGFSQVGRETIGGVGGPGRASSRFNGGPFQLGPLEIEALDFIDVGAMKKASQALGEPVVGVIGWDVLVRAIVGIDLRDGRLLIRDPETYRLPSEFRNRLFLHWKVPYVSARFADAYEGPFMLDTGAGHRGVIFTRFSTERFGLLPAPSGPESTVTGAGGQVTAVAGEIEWFEVAGHRTAPAPATFLVSDDGESDIFTIGFLGGAVISPFWLVLDYARGECGLIPDELVDSYSTTTSSLSGVSPIRNETLE